jgi:hypothetical protein
MTTAIFCKSYPDDLQWLPYARRSIEKFCSGFSEVVLCLPPDCGFDWPDARIVHVDERAPGYMWQQAVKLYADALCSADTILFHDSDGVFTQPVTPSAFMVEGKPIWLMEPWENVSADARRAWFPVMQKFCGEEPQHEFMRRHPFLFPRWLFRELRTFCRFTHHKPLDEYIMSQPNHEFSEFNCAGFYAWLHHRDRFCWRGPNDVPTVVKQYWSYGGIGSEVKRELESILA